MKLATWNVNSLKVRLQQLVDWLAQNKPDVVCLQETKLEDVKFPTSELEANGFRASFCGQKTYPPRDGHPDEPRRVRSGEQRR